MTHRPLTGAASAEPRSAGSQRAQRGGPDQAGGSLVARPLGGWLFTVARGSRSCSTRPACVVTLLAGLLGLRSALPGLRGT